MSGALVDLLSKAVALAEAQRRDDAHVVWALRDEDGEAALTVGDVRALLTSSVPAPPALVEAVGPVIDELRGYEIAMADPREDGTLHINLLRGDARRLRAAYDAAKGGESKTWCDGCHRMVDVKTLWCPACAAPSPDAEDAAKYRAAVKRLDDRAGQAKAVHDAWGSDLEGASARWVLYGDGPSPVPRETLDKARVVEVLRDFRDAADRESGSGPITSQIKGVAWGARKIAERLGLTLDAPDGGSK